MSEKPRIAIQEIRQGNFRALARAISYVENGISDLHELLTEGAGSGDVAWAGLIGITGPPGAGKSTLVDALIGEFVRAGEKLAVLCVDPSSSFHYGALLGDRIRMSDWYNHPNVFIRSLSSRGSLGGLHPRVPEIADLLKLAGFDRVIVETVGVGQSEIEIAALADITVVVLVPEGGDEIQTMKAGILEIADIFVVNKCDRPGADLFARNLQHSREHGLHQVDPPAVIKTNALEKQGVAELAQKIIELGRIKQDPARKIPLLAERAWYMIRNERIKDLDKRELALRIGKEVDAGTFNLYRFVSGFGRGTS
ncbi:MAG: methylmalonyl Co-A mutase-associated GTPase MeaB [Bacteroidota bacterium]|nr:methylmalonyl Co-A mutase-associated GTPase MeaB [Bacteroidota bacterium]